MDYERDSDFDDVAGHWYVCTHPTRPNWSQVYYSADLALKNYVPGFIMNILTTSALKTAVSWVKKFSEAEWVEEEKCSVTGAGKFPRFGRGVRDETRMFKIGGLKALHPFSIAPSPPPAATGACAPSKAHPQAARTARGCWSCWGDCCRFGYLRCCGGRDMRCHAGKR